MADQPKSDQKLKPGKALEPMSAEQAALLTAAGIGVEGASAPASQNRNSLREELDFNSPGMNVDQYAKAELAFTNGNFEMPKPLLKAAKHMAEELIKLAKTQGIDLSKSPEWKDAVGLTNDGKISAESLSAYLLAKSMASNTSGVIDGGFKPPGVKPENKVRAVFDNNLDAADFDSKANPKMVFEMARQIMGDNGMRNVVGAPTNTKEADAKFTSEQAGNADKTSGARC